MRKLFMLFLLMVMALGILPSSSAAPVAGLTALASYFPADTSIFVAMSTDDAFIQSIDGLIARIAAKLPAGAIPAGINLSSLLDLGASQLTGETFQTGIRSWLGDTAVIGTGSTTVLTGSATSFLAAMEITDRELATVFFTDLLTRNGVMDRYTTTTEGEFTVLSSEFIGGAIAINDTVLFVGGTADDLPLTALDGSLAVNAEFGETVGLLPADEYHLLAYIDTSALLGVMLQNTPPSPGMDLTAIANILEAQAVGLTMLDERTVAIDAVNKVGDVSALTVLGANYDLSVFSPLDPAFAANIPADSSLVFHLSNFEGLVDAYLQSFAAASGATPEQIDQQRAIINTMMQAQTGLDLDEDILGWMSGDFALAVRIDSVAILDALRSSMLEGAQPSFSALPFGFAFIIEATDAAKAQNLASVVGELIVTPMAQVPSENVTVSQEQIGGVDVTVISQPMPMGEDMILPFEMVLGANDNVLFVATRAEAEQILSGTSGLDTSAAYQEASAHFLDNPTTVFYSDRNGAGGGIVVLGLALLGPQIGNTFNNIVDELSTPTAEQLLQREEQRRIQEMQNQQMLGIFDLLINFMSSSSISTAATADGDSISRIVITLSE